MKGCHMKEIINIIKNSPSFQPWLSTSQQLSSQLILGLSGSAKHLAQAALFETLKVPVMIITPTQLQAVHAFEELQAWYPQEQVHLFSAEESLAAEMAFVSPEIRSQRVEALQFLRDKKPGFIVLSLAALRKRLVPASVWDGFSLSLQLGSQVPSIEHISQQLSQMGYRRESMVAAPGEYSVRGSIIDVYSIHQDHPYRIDLFDIEVDSLRTFDVENQRSIENLKEIHILPANELPISKEALLTAAPNIEAQIDKEASRIKDQNVKELVMANKKSLLEQLQAQEIVNNAHWWLDLIYPEKTSILDYFSEEGHVVLDDFARIMERERSLSEEEAHWLMMKQSQGVVINKEAFAVPIKDILKDSRQAKTYFALFQKGLGNKRFDAVHNISYRAMTQFFSQMPLVKVEFDRWKKQKLSGFVVVSDAKRARKVEQTFNDFQIDVIISDQKEVRLHQIQIIVGSIQSGFELPKDKVFMINERELFNRITKKTPKAQKISNAERLKSYTELAVGDYVVHVNHGIGKYQGMETLEINGVHQDYISIHYKDGGNLFVPITQIKLVQKYVSSDAKEPKINKLGSSDWNKTKRKVAAKIEDIADDLIQLYAKRDSEKGYAFSKDIPEQKEFEDEFPYSETDDQLRSVAEIKGDMEKDRPMDRLLVGDVGYGKTEVALRAMFKALADGKQAAILVPTTILAEQHYENFVQRFANYPFSVGLLSRFRTKKQQEETIADLKAGRVDVVVGTHRLLSKDVQFLDLGLLVIDEEQRFGVRHKERLKQLKTQVDVLTLTATPIPRTLHMSMLGVRDLSVIETPPANRYPVQTYVMEQDNLTIRDGIEREMARGGQVFYLYNRVDTIERKADEIRQLVPGVRVGVAHGQMTETSLENILYQFIEGEFDVLVTTTIIETGVDIANVNTLFVENADRMGLSQLYQLRGRVGRTNRVAYAYLMYQPNKILTEVSEKRLQAMKDFTDLGSGFKIAMRDLSIRGAGNLLGQQQHGFIDSVGFDLFSEMLNEAVLKKQGKPRDRRQDELVEIDLAIDAYLPSTYIQDERQKIEIYKRIRSIENEEAYSTLLDDLIDRFGEFPDQVADLVEIGMIKTLAEEVGIRSIKRVKQSLTLIFTGHNAAKLEGAAIFEALSSIKQAAQVTKSNDELSVLINISNLETDQWLRVLKTFIKACYAILFKEDE